MTQSFQHHIKQGYNILKKKQVFSENNDDIGKNYAFSMEFYFNIVPQLTDEYHERHKLSLNDYQKILKGVGVKDLLKMAIKNKLQISSSVIKTDASGNYQDEDLTYLSSVPFNKKIEKFIIKTKKLSLNDKLIARNDLHQPPLPVHFVSRETLLSLPSPRKYYNHLFKWCNVYWVPFSYYNGYIKMIKVIPRHIYEIVYSKPRNILSQPPEYLIDKLVYSGTTEYMLLQTMENHNLLSSLTSSQFEELEFSLFRGQAPLPQ
jgi:hypothetical protein